MSEWRETIEAIRILGPFKVAYLRFIYRHHMRFIHKLGKHQLKHFGPPYPDGGEFDKCEWCGHMENIEYPAALSVRDTRRQRTD